MQDRPLFPIKVHFFEDGDEWIFDDDADIAQNLEWFDSDDIEENASVTDRLNRPVRLKVEALSIIVLELAKC